MRLRIVQIADRGVPGKERVHIAVLSDATLSYYVVLNSSRLNSTTIANGSTSAFWFDNVSVRAGDNVVLYTGPGTNSSNLRSDGGRDYFIFWGLKNVIWPSPQSCAVLVELSSWETSPA